MENAKPIGLPDNPRKLSHSVLVEEKMDEKFPSGGGYKSNISKAFLSVAGKDWHGLAHPEEDIYDDYKA